MNTPAATHSGAGVEPSDPQWRDRIACALTRHEFTLHYQPKVDMRGGTVVGLEALIRWNHPELGLLQPAAFIPRVEDHALIESVGDWVIGEAARQAGRWRELGLHTSIAVNVSPRHLQHPDFINRLAMQLDAVPGLHANALELEIVETSVIHDMCRAVDVVRACRQLGVAVTLDDFGTGYACLTELRELPVTGIKLDRSFVGNILHSKADQAIVDGILLMARGLDISVIAEGVESPAHGAALLERGCTLGQGFGIARPMHAVDVPGWIVDYERAPLWQRTVAA